MGDSHPTRPSLLARLCNHRDDESWAQFVAIYGPLVYGFARKQGLQDADAADLTQEALRQVARSMPDFDYDPARGTFRGWLFTVVRNLLTKFGKCLQRPGLGAGNTEALDRLEEIPDSAETLSALWEAEHERQLYAWAAEKVRGEVQESTWRAFHETAVLGHAPAEVAGRFGMSVAAVYLAKNRVMVRLKARVRELDAES
ncbi:MAG: sigma-70 family RNA polymerase sigma factor [Gemmataceae bacterium]|nr:sigma-70 family RNA polymerase sigma factor [Gemmataceae bacterium]MCI0739549.1 sigma-70 family RNA polymerase sigma factor [Gemmataceae bacterium]